MAFLFRSFWFDLCLCFVSAGCVLYLWYRHKFDYWKKKGVPGPEPSVPFGSIKQMALGNKHFGEVIAQIYEQSKQHPFIGAYLLHRPALVVNDLDLVKTILVKDFIHFTDHGVKFDHKWEPIRAGLFHVTGKDWKRLRAKLTPAFTVSKVKGMFDTIASCGTAMQKFLEAKAAVGGTIDAKDVMGKFTSDVIVSVAFGIDSNSFTSSPAVYKQMGSMVFDLDLRKRLSQFLSFFVPNVQRVLGFRLVDKKVGDFFSETIEATVKFREENNVIRKDIMHCLIQLKNNQSIEEITEEFTESHHPKEENPWLTMSELSAQAFGFFVAGYETSSTLLSFTIYEMARHPDLQVVLHRELDQILDKYNGEITYEGLKEMTYMLQVIHEALRLYPTLPIVFRICTKRYVIPGTDVVIEKDTPVIIPTWGIQKDPAIYPNPLEFDPTRFTPENKAARHPYSLLSFGEGPRICIARKVAMLQIQIALVSVFRYYKVSIIDDNPIEISKKTFFVTPKEGINIKIEKRF